MADLAVVIVTWNVRDLALNALTSLFEDLKAHGPASAQVYVVDNASSDDTVAAIRAAFPQVHVIASAENLGFGRANNLALHEIGFGEKGATALPKAVYFLNPDTLTHPGATRTLYDTLLSTPHLGLVGAALEYEDGDFQHAAFYFPGLRQIWAEFFPMPGRFYESAFNGRYSRSQYLQGQPFNIDFPLGATMMLRRETIEQTRGFDEQFFMYCEETDWAWRIHKAGWLVRCVPAAVVTHLEGRSTGQARPQSIINLWQSRLRLYAKHHPSWKVWLARQLIRMGMRRKINQATTDSSLTDTQRSALIEAYRAVQKLARGHQP